MNNTQENIYAPLNICQYESEKNLPQKQQTLNDLGNTTQSFLNIYLPANAAFVSAMNDKYYPSISFDIKALDEITRMPIAHTKTQLENANLGQQSITNSQGLASFTLLKRRDNDKTRFS